MNARAFGTLLKRFFSSEQAYVLLDASRETRGTTWQAGGCWALAQALHQSLPGSELVAVESEGVQHHVLVQRHGWYFDADGASSQRTLLDRWRRRERLVRPKVVPFRPDAAEGLVCPADLVNRLRSSLGPLVVAGSAATG